MPDHDLRRRTEPPAGGRARDAQIRRDGHVAGAVDELPQPMVIALLRTGRGHHPDDHRPFAHAAQLLADDAGPPPGWRELAREGAECPWRQLGVPQDDVEAYKWSDLAASRVTGDTQKRYSANRDALAEQMTPAQIAEAKRLAREWQAAFEKRQAELGS